MATGDIQSLTVLGTGPTDDMGNVQPCAGIVVALLIEGMGRRDPISDVKADFSSLTLTVQDPGYDDTMTLVTRTRTVRGTLPLHNTYPTTWAALLSSVSARTWCSAGTQNTNLYYSASAGTKGSAAPTHVAAPNTPNTVGASTANGGVAWTALGDGTFPGYVEAVSGGNVIVYAILDFPVFAGSTITAASLGGPVAGAGAYRVGAVSSRAAASIPTIVNNSTLAYEITQVIPVTIDHFLSQGSSHRLELKCSHTWPMLGRAVAFARGRARNMPAGGAASTEAGAWATLTPDISQLVGLGNAASPSRRAVEVYAGTINTTGVSAGEAFDEYEVYPWLGTRVFKSAEDGEGADRRASTFHPLGSVCRNGANLYHASAITTGISGSGSGPTGTGTGITDGGITWDFYGSDLTIRNGPNPPARLHFYNDPSSVYRTGHFMVDPAGTATSTESAKVYSTYAAASAAGATLSNCFPNVRAGMLAAQAYNQLTGGTTHNDSGGATAWLKPGTHVGLSDATALSGIPKGSVWSYVRADPAAAPGTVIMSLADTANKKTPGRRTYFSGIKMTMTTGQAGFIDGQIDTAVGPLQSVAEAVIDGFDIAAETTANRYITRIGSVWYRNNNHTGAFALTILGGRATAVDAMGIKSVTSITTGLALVQCPHWIGCDLVGYNTLATPSNNPNQRYKFWFIEDNYVGGGTSGNGTINCNGGANATGGASINPYLGTTVCGNLVEPFGSAAGRNMRCFADQTTFDMSNVVVAYNTFVGQRANFGYDDQAATPLHRQFYVLNNIFDTTNVVSEGSSHSGSSKGVGRFQNLWVAARVGWEGNVALKGSNSTLGSFAGYWYRVGTNSNEGAFPVSSDARSQWVNAQYVDDVGSAGAGLGGGTYLPATGAIVLGRTITPGRVYDLAGSLRRTNGSGLAGALEQLSANLTPNGGAIAFVGAAGVLSAAPSLAPANATIAFTGAAAALAASAGMAGSAGTIALAGSSGVIIGSMTLAGDAGVISFVGEPGALTVASGSGTVPPASRTIIARGN